MSSSRTVRALIGSVRMTLLVAAGVILASGAEAQVTPTDSIVVTTCPAVLDVPGARYVLTEDLICNSPSPGPAYWGLTITGIGILVNLNGHTLHAGTQSEGGIVVSADNVTIQGGALRGWPLGVLAEQGVALTIRSVTADGNLSLYGQSSTVQGSLFSSAEILGTGHVLRGNALGNTSILLRTWIAPETSDIDLVGNELGQTLIDPDVRRVVIRGNVIAGSLIGLSVCGSDHLVQSNTIVVSSGRGTGLSVCGTATAVVIKSNSVSAAPALNQAAFGITVFLGATDTIIQSNTAVGFRLFDVKDDNPDCGTNSWKSNTFGTASTPNSPCIK